MLNQNDFCKRFCELEESHKLFDVEFNGITYWKHARYFVLNMIRYKLYGTNVPFWFDNDKRDTWKLSKYTHEYQKLTDKLFHNINLCTQKDVLLFSSSRRVKDGKKYVSPMTDEISLRLERSHCILEAPYCGGYYRPALVKGIKYFDVWNGVGEDTKLRAPLNRGRFRKQILKIFEDEFGIEFTNEEKKILLVNINYYIMYRNDLINNYKKIIKKIAPKVVLYTCAYIGDMVVLTEALKEMNIPSIELLHGYVEDTTVPYNYSNINLNDALPDYIFAFSQIQKDIIHWGIPKKNVRVVGWPWLEKKKNELSVDVDRQKKKKTILFISSGNPVIAKYVDVLSRELDQNQYEIILKLHPTEFVAWKEQYHNLPDAVQVIDNNEHDIYFYFAKSDIVIGIVSTALYEAAIYPVPIFILAEDMYERMNILLRSGRAELVHDETALLSCVTKESGGNYKMDAAFFAEHAMENINNEIENIITERGKSC